MGEVIHATFLLVKSDGGKSRVLRRHPKFKLGTSCDRADDLKMDHADPEDTRPSELA